MTRCRYLVFFRCLALAIAANYLVFRIELFQEEFENNHPLVSSGLFITLPALNWETFDKDNAPSALSIGVEKIIELIATCDPFLPADARSCNSLQIIRDKSPPVVDSVG